MQNDERGMSMFFSKNQQLKLDSIKKHRRLKVAHIAFRIIQIAVLLSFAYEMYLRITTGRPTSNILFYFLLLTIPAKIYNIVLTRNTVKKDSEEQREYDQIVLRSILIGVGFVILFSAVVAIYYVSTTS